MPPIQIDLSGLATQIVTALVEAIRSVGSPMPMSFMQWLLAGVQTALMAQGAGNVMTHVPLEWTSQHGEVVALWRAMLPVQTLLAGLVVVVQSFRVMKGGADVFDVIFRTGLMMIIGNTLIWSSSQVITLMNVISDFVGAVPLAYTQQSAPADLVLAVMLLIGAFFAVLTWIKGAIGAVFICVLIVVGPIMLMLSCLPLFEGLGKWWAEEMTTWLLRGFMVALVLRLGLGIGVIHGGGFQMMFAIAAFWLAWTMDTRLRKFSVGAWGSIGQMGLMARGAGMLAGLATGGTGGAVATRGAAAAATP